MQKVYSASDLIAEAKAEKRLKQLFQVRDQKRSDGLMMALLTFICQLILCSLIFIQLFFVECNIIAFHTMMSFVSINYARWICATILHLVDSYGVVGSLERMKYTLNHKYKFYAPNRAFIISFLEFTITTTVEVCNISIILAQTNPINIVLNFIAIEIIAQFDEFVYTALRNESGKLLIEMKIADDVLMIHHTTSSKCGVDELSDVKDQNVNFRKLRIQFKDRDCGNKVGWVVYRILRIFFVSIYFYFLPFFVIGLAIVVPAEY